MTIHMNTSLVEGQSSSRPSLFNGTNYYYWKARMRIYIQAIDFQLWRVIIKETHTPIIKVNSIDIPKLEAN